MLVVMYSFISMIENEFVDDTTPEAAYIWINDDYVAQWRDFDDSTFELLEYSDATYYNLVKYSYIDEVLSDEQYIVVAFDLNEWVAGNTFNSYLLHGEMRMQISCELPANYSTRTCVDDNNNADYVFNCAITSDTYVEDVYSNDELFVQFSRVGDCFTLSLFANSAVSNGVWDNVLFNGNNIIFGKQYATL